MEILNAKHGSAHTIDRRETHAGNHTVVEITISYVVHVIVKVLAVQP